MSRHDNRQPIGLDHLVDAAPGGSYERRDRVFRHPDLLKRLTEPPLRFTDPYRWTGWIPPRTCPEQACGSECGTRQRACSATHNARYNDSPFRRALVEIAAEAYRREQQPALDEVEE